MFIFSHFEKNLCRCFIIENVSVICLNNKNKMLKKSKILIGSVLLMTIGSNQSYTEQVNTKFKYNGYYYEKDENQNISTYFVSVIEWLLEFCNCIYFYDIF